MAKPITQVLLWNNTGTSSKDVTAYVKSVNISRGRSRELDRFQPGTFNISFDNRARVFDPKYTSSPIYGFVTPKRMVQIIAGSQIQFQGYVQDWNFSYDVSGESIATANGADAFSFLAQQTLGSNHYLLELTGARLANVLTDPNVTWPFGGIYSIFDDGTRYCQEEYVTAGTNVLEYMQLVERTEGGYFYIDRYGNLTFLDNKSTLGNSIVFQDQNLTTLNNIGYQGIDIAYGSELLYNIVTLSRLAGGTVTKSSAGSISTYGAATWSDSGLLYNTDTDLDNQARLTLGRYKVPEYRIDSVTVTLNPLSTTNQSNLLQYDIGYIAKVIFTPNHIGTAVGNNAGAFMNVRIIGIDHQITVESHTVTYRFESLENTQFILDSSSMGLLDLNVLGF